MGAFSVTVNGRKTGFSSIKLKIIDKKKLSHRMLYGIFFYLRNNNPKLRKN